MSFGEIAVRVLADIKPLLPGFIAAIVATLIAMIVISILGRHTWVGKRHFPLPSLFFSLDARGTLRIACAWLKLIFLIVFLVSFQKMVLIQYLMILLPGLLLALLAGRLSQIGSGLFWLLLQLMGLFCANMVCGYIRDMAAGIGFILVYIAISVFMALFSVYMFLLDLDSISGSRSIDANQIWRTKQHEEDE